MLYRLEEHHHLGSLNPGRQLALQKLPVLAGTAAGAATRLVVAAWAYGETRAWLTEG